LCLGLIKENEEMSVAMINKSRAPMCMGHLELNGFRATPGHMMEHGMKWDIFKKFKKHFLVTIIVDLIKIIFIIWVIHMRCSGMM
jgi:hypothetical protein